jgi:hypothetical protein
VVPGILLGIGAGLGVDDEVAVLLLVQRDVLGLVPGDFGEAHFGEQVPQQLNVRRGIFHELEPVGAHRVFEAQRPLFGYLGGHSFVHSLFARFTAPDLSALQDWAAQP